MEARSDPALTSSTSAREYEGDSPSPRPTGIRPTSPIRARAFERRGDDGRGSDHPHSATRPRIALARPIGTSRPSGRAGSISGLLLQREPIGGVLVATMRFFHARNCEAERGDGVGLNAPELPSILRWLLPALAARAPHGSARTPPKPAALRNGTDRRVGRSDRAIDYFKDVRPILETRCYACHGPKKQKADLRLDQKDAAFGETSDGLKVIRPGAQCGKRALPPRN